MLKYYTNRTLSGSLGTNLAKWKRWSREFLPPDPLGGMQSGYARQYTPDEAFTVYLGGHLVAALHFTIPEARQVLNDLAEWLAGNGFSYEVGKTAARPGQPVKTAVPHYLIFITPARSGTPTPAKDTPNGKNDRGFYYLIRGTLSAEPELREGMRIVVEHVIESSLPPSTPPTMALPDMNPVSVLNITALLKHFTRNLDLEPSSYLALLGIAD